MNTHILPDITHPTALEALAAKLNPTAPRKHEPIFTRLYDEYIDSADSWDWGPGGIGRVIEDMGQTTAPDRPRHLAAARG